MSKHCLKTERQSKAIFSKHYQHIYAQLIIQ